MLSPWDLEQFRAMPSLMPALGVLFAAGGGLVLKRAAVRRIADPNEPLLSQLEALGLFTIAATALLIPFGAYEWNTLELEIPALVLLPIMAILLVGTQDSARIWAMQLRKTGRAPQRWWLLIGMMVVFAVVAAVKTKLSPLPAYEYDYFDRTAQTPGWSNWIKISWLAFTAATMVVFSQFASARYERGSHRMAFSMAVFAHLCFQAICIAAFDDRYVKDMVFQGMALAVVVPALVVWRTWALRKRVLGGLSD